MRFFWPIALTLFFGCTFHPEGDYFNPIKPPTGENSTVEIENQTEPITVYWPTTFHYRVKPEESGPYQAEITFDGKLLISSSSQNGFFSFTIIPTQYTNGEKELKITATHLTKSGSLAGQTGSEVLVFSRVFRVIIDNVKPSAVKAPRVAIEEGKLMVRWDPPNKTNFQKLVVLKHYVVDYVHQSVDTLRPASNNDTFIHDQSYVGGEVRYTVDLKAPGMYLVGEEASFSCDPVTLSFDSDSSEIKWTRPLIYGNNIDLIINNVDHISAENAGSYRVDVPFGSSAFASVTINPLNPERYNPIQYTKRIEAFQGKRCATFDKVEYLPSDNSFIFFTSNQLSKVEGYSFSTIGVPSFYASMLMQSINGLYTYIWNGNVLSNGLGLRKTNSSALNISESYDLKTIMGGSPLLEGRPMITDNNMLCGRFSGTFFPYYVLDMTTQTVLWKGQVQATLSHNSEHMLRSDSVFARGNNNWKIFEGRIATSGLTNFVFYENEVIDRLYATAANGTLEVFDLNGPANGVGELPKVLHNLPAVPSGYKVDSFGNALYSIESSGTVKVYDISTFQLKKTITSIFEPFEVVYLNGSLLHQNGFVLPKN